LGHRHPRIVAVLRQALEELDIGNHHLMSEHRRSTSSSRP
jgi:acetylornithine/succinyldiaminopimelate/putrescine aminotransferase